MDKNNSVTFEEIFEQNQKRIHYHIHKLRINDPHQEFYQEGLCAMWNAYETYNPDKGVMSTYFNFTIHNRLVDMLRQKTREKHNENICVQEEGNNLFGSNRIRKSDSLIPDLATDAYAMDDSSTRIWEEIRSLLTESQWSWVYHYILLNMSVKEIAKQEGTTIDSIKSQGKRVRKKLKDEGLWDKLKEPSGDD